MKLVLIKNNYFSTFSKWIANLGVVPLLLFLAFLLCPALTFFASLLFLVTRVFETIFQLLSNLKNRGHLLEVSLITYLPSFLRLQVLPRADSLVKVIATAVLYLFATQSETLAQFSKNQELTSQHLSLAKGEIVTIPIVDSRKFTVANREVISVKLTDKGRALLIKGKSLGISDLIIWPKSSNKRPIHFHLNVLGKRTYQKLAYQRSLLNKTGLTSKIIGKNLHITGQTDSIQTYRHLVSAKNILKERLIFETIKLEPTLKRTVYTKFLETLMKQGILNLNCELPIFKINCFETKEMTSTIKELSKNFLITSISSETKNKLRQFSISLTLQQFESSNGQVFSLGLDKLHTSWQEVIDTNPLALIKNNSIHISKNNYKSKTIARPQIMGRLNHPVKIKIGQEISYFQNSNQGNFQNNRTRQWRFAGLALDIELKSYGEEIQVQYSNSLSKPEQDTISTNSQRSSIILSPGSSQVLFNIGFETNQSDVSKFPILSNFPLLGSLFKNEGKSSTYKKILCLIKIEEI